MPEGEILRNEIIQLMRQPDGSCPAILDVFAEKYGYTAKELMENAQTLLPEKKQAAK